MSRLHLEQLDSFFNQTDTYSPLSTTSHNTRRRAIEVVDRKRRMERARVRRQLLVY
jgi:hypothetical protein